MVYVDSSGNIIEKPFSIVETVLGFFSFIVLFVKSFLGLDSSKADTNENRDHLRRSGGGGSNWPGSGGPGGPGRGGNGGGFRRQIGRLPTASGMSCPPMSGGG